MTQSGRSEEEKSLALPAITKNEISRLIQLITLSRDNKLVDQDNVSKINDLIKRLNQINDAIPRDKTPPDDTSLKVHSEIMKTYLVDGYSLQRKLITKGKPSIRTCLATALKEFNKENRSLFVGYIDVEKEKPEDLIEVGIIHSTRHPQEVKDIVEGCYKQVRHAMTEWAANFHDSKYASEAQRIYQNAKRIVIELEDKPGQMSSHLWNKLLEKDGFDRTALVVPVETPNDYDNRNKKSVGEYYTQNKKIIGSLVQENYFPYFLINLLIKETEKMAPEGKNDPESIVARDKIKILIGQIKAVLERKPNPGKELEAIEMEIFKLCSTLYHDTYIYDTSKSGHSVVRSTLQKILENTYLALSTSGKVDLLLGPGEKIYDKILNATTKKDDDSPTLATEKFILMQEQVRKAFDIAMRDGLQASSAKAEDIFVYAYKSILKQGYFAIAELNKCVQDLQIPPTVANNPDLQNMKDRKKYYKLTADIQNKFGSFLGMKEKDESYKEDDLIKLYRFVKSTPGIMEIIKNKFPVLRQENEEKNAFVQPASRPSDSLNIREESKQQSSQMSVSASAPIAPPITPPSTRSPSPVSYSQSTKEQTIVNPNAPPAPPPTLKENSTTQQQRYGLFTAPSSTATTASSSLASSVQPTRSATPTNEDDVIPPPPPLPPSSQGVLNIPKGIADKNPPLKVDTDAAASAAPQRKFNIQSDSGDSMIAMIAKAMASRRPVTKPEDNNDANNNDTSPDEWDSPRPKK